MTREKLKSIILDWELEDDTGNGCNNKGTLSDRILAALDEERAGEVVISEGECCSEEKDDEGGSSGGSWVGNIWMDTNALLPTMRNIEGKTGQLIFRPDKS